MNINNEEQKIPIDGFQQVLDMLKIADPDFRESLLKRIEMKNAQLAQTLRQDLRRSRSSQ